MCILFSSQAPDVALGTEQVWLVSCKKSLMGFSINFEIMQKEVTTGWHERSDGCCAYLDLMQQIGDV